MPLAVFGFWQSPNTPIQIDVLPPRPQYLTNTGNARQLQEQRQLTGVSHASTRQLLKQVDQFGLSQHAVAFHVLSDLRFLDACRGVDLDVIAVHRKTKHLTQIGQGLFRCTGHGLITGRA